MWQPPAPGCPPPPSVMQTRPTSIFSLRERIDTRTPPPFAVVSRTPTWTPSTLRAQLTMPSMSSQLARAPSTMSVVTLSTPARPAQCSSSVDSTEPSSRSLPGLGRSSRLRRDRRRHDARADQLAADAQRLGVRVRVAEPAGIADQRHVERHRGLGRDRPALVLGDPVDEHADRGGRRIPHRDVAERLAARVVIERDQRAADFGRRQRVAEQRDIGAVDDDRAVEALVEADRVDDRRARAAATCSGARSDRPSRSRLPCPARAIATRGRPSIRCRRRRAGGARSTGSAPSRAASRTRARAMPRRRAAARGSVTRR